MKRHVSLALIPIDDYTNQVITGNELKPRIMWEKEAIWKQGFYIFIDVRQERFNLHIESELYQSRDVMVTLDSQETKIMKLRFVPSKRYAKEDAYIVVWGTGKPKETVTLYSDEIRQHYKLIKDYEPGNQIGIFHPKDMDLSGKKIWVKGREKSWFATLGELSEEEENYYHVEGLTEKIRKVEVDIFLIQEHVVREDGTFYFLFPEGKTTEFRGVMEYEGRNEEVILKADGENKFNLKEE